MLTCKLLSRVVNCRKRVLRAAVLRDQWGKLVRRVVENVNKTGGGLPYTESTALVGDIEPDNAYAPASMRLNALSTCGPASTCSRPQAC